MIQDLDTTESLPMPQGRLERAFRIHSSNETVLLNKVLRVEALYSRIVNSNAAVIMILIVKVVGTAAKSYDWRGMRPLKRYAAAMVVPDR